MYRKSPKPVKTHATSVKCFVKLQQWKPFNRIRSRRLGRSFLFFLASAPARRQKCFQHPSRHLTAARTPDAGKHSNVGIP